MRTRRRFSSEFKAKVALEAIKSHETVAELATSRKVLAWRLSNTMDAEFCVAALEEAIARYGRPEIFNTDQGSQFTGFAFTNTLKDADKLPSQKKTETEALRR